MNLKFCEDNASNAANCINGAQKKIKLAIADIVEINVPKGYCKNEIDTVCGNLDKIEAGLVSFNTWLNKKIKVLIDAEKECQNIAESLKQNKENIEEIAKKAKSTTAVTKGNVRQFFSIINTGMFFGANQGMFKYIDKDNSEYIRAVNILRSKYNMPYQDAVDLIQYIDSIGICTYASAASKIVNEYATKPEIFKADFGFPLYIQTAEGEVDINYSELLLDMYIENNTNGSGNDNLKKKANGKIKIKKDAFEVKTEKDGDILTEKKKLKYQDYMEMNEFNNYIKTKAGKRKSTELSSLEEQKALLIDEPEKVDKAAIETLKKLLDYDKKRGSGVRLSLFPNGYYVGTNWGGEVPFYSTEEDENGKINEVKTILEGAHSVFVTGNNDNGIYIASWGKEYFIKYEDIINNHIPFYILDDVNVDKETKENMVDVELDYSYSDL